MRKILILSAAFAGALGLTACGTDSGPSNDTPAADSRPHVVVTTNVFADVVTAAFGADVDVDVVMPRGADPHEFAASAQQAAAMERADLLVVNGAGFEQGLLDVIDSVTSSGTEIFTVADHVELLTGGEHGTDPHLWTDPNRVATAVAALTDTIATLDGVDPTAVAEHGAAYVAALTDLDAEITEALAAIPADGRVLVTNHEALAYFAERYQFEIAGTVIPSLSTNAESSARSIERLADVIRSRSIGAIFAETTSSTDLAAALADQIGTPVAVVELYTESLGELGSGADTYLSMMRTNAHLIATALAPR